MAPANQFVSRCGIFSLSNCLSFPCVFFRACPREDCIRLITLMSLRQIEGIDRPSESLRAHEECTRGRGHRVKRVSVLNLGNYYFPHTFGLFAGGFHFERDFRRVREIDLARSIQFGNAGDSPRTAKEPSPVELRDGDSQLNVLLIGAIMA